MVQLAFLPPVYPLNPFASFNGLATDVVEEGFVLVVIHHIIIFMVVTHLSFCARVIFLFITDLCLCQLVLKFLKLRIGLLKVIFTVKLQWLFWLRSAERSLARACTCCSR